MRSPYVVERARTPQPSLGGSLHRPRPILPVRLLGPSGDRLTDGLRDTGADDTVFPEWLAAVVGIELGRAEERLVGLAGRPPIRCRSAPVRLRITDGRTASCEWPAVVGLLAAPLPRPRLGLAGFLPSFDAEFRGAGQEVILAPNPAFPGQFRVHRPPSP